MGLEEMVLSHVELALGGWTKLRSWGTIFLASSWRVIRAHNWSRADSVAQKYSADISATRMAVVGLHDRQSRRYSTWRNSGRTKDLIELKCGLLTEKKIRKKVKLVSYSLLYPDHFCFFSHLLQGYLQSWLKRKDSGLICSWDVICVGEEVSML